MLRSYLTNRDKCSVLGDTGILRKVNGVKVAQVLKVHFVEALLTKVRQVTILKGVLQVIVGRQEHILNLQWKQELLHIFTQP